MKKIAVVLCLMLGGCATMLNGPNQMVTISTTPAGAVARASNGDSCLTPCIMTLSRKMPYTIMFEKDDHQTAGATLTPKTSSLVWLNVFNAGVGAFFDMGIGGAYELEPHNVYANLPKK